MEFLSYLISGISLGSVYAIIALGYTMVYGIAKMLNFAHGDVIMVGGYVSFCAVSYWACPAGCRWCWPWQYVRRWVWSLRGWPTNPCGRPPPWRCSSPPSE